MAVPKIRSSKSRVRKRRASNSKFHPPQLDNCPQCDHLGYQRHRACPECGHSISELEPRLFSFNNPAGACPTCDGLGVKQFFDARRLVNGELTLAEGAIRGWDRRNVYYFQMLSSLAEHYGIDLDMPFDQIPDEHRKLILQGTGNDKVPFRYLNDRGDVVQREHPFEGIVPNLERRYRETESEAVREDLASYLSTSTCPSCDGSRLREAARNVFIDNTTLPELVRLAVGKSFDYFDNLKLPGNRGEIAEKILKEIRDRLQATDPRTDDGNVEFCREDKEYFLFLWKYIPGVHEKGKKGLLTRGEVDDLVKTQGRHISVTPRRDHWSPFPHPTAGTTRNKALSALLISMDRKYKDYLFLHFPGFWKNLCVPKNTDDGRYSHFWKLIN